MFVSREALGIVAHFSLAPVSSPHVSAYPICPKSLPLMSQPAPFAPSHFPHVLPCPQSVPPMSQLAHFARPPVALSTCPVSVSKSLYFVRRDDTFVVIGRESYFIHLFCGEIVLATSNDIHRP